VCCFEKNLESHMSSDVLIIREGNGYRVLFGYLRLAAVLSMANEVLVDVKGEGKAKIIKTPMGLLVNKDSLQLPLLRN
jgi:hypothetical protein